MKSSSNARRMLVSKGSCITGIALAGVLALLVWRYNVELSISVPLTAMTTTNILRMTDAPPSSSSGTTTNRTSSSSSSSSSASSSCTCIIPAESNWSAQSKQDKYMFDSIFQHKDLCCKGVFVEFGARDGISHSNSYAFERFMGWKGVLFEIDPREFQTLQQNRPTAKTIKGAVCPKGIQQIPFVFSSIPGWSGALKQYEPNRLSTEHQLINVTCYELQKVLTAERIHRVDYMTIDTEGSELDIIMDFPWNKFDIKVVQVEQLVADLFPNQTGKKEKVIQHLTSAGYVLHHIYKMGDDTEDIMMVKKDFVVKEVKRR